jgi:hypothetical protein
MVYYLFAIVIYTVSENKESKTRKEFNNEKITWHGPALGCVCRTWLSRIFTPSLYEENAQKMER